MLATESKSSLIIEAAQPADDPALRRLLRETPMGGSIEVAFLREPNFFFTTESQGTFTQVVVGRVANEIVGVGTRAIRPSYINGDLVDAGYLADLRLRSQYRGGTFVARGYRHLRRLHEDRRTEIYSTVVIASNQRALQTIAANRAGLPRYTPLGRILTPMIHLRRRLPAIEGDICRGSLEMLPDIVAKLNENRLQFAPAYCEVDFLGGRFRGFRISDFYVLRRGGSIAGVMGVWDQRSFRQTVVTRYNGALGKLRPLINLVRRPRLPERGEPLRFFYASFISTDDVRALAALLRRVHNDATGGEHTHFTLGLHEEDPRAAVLREYAMTPFSGRLFAVTFDGPPELDGRVPYVDAGLI